MAPECPGKLHFRGPHRRVSPIYFPPEMSAMLVHRLSDWLARQIWLRILTSKKLAKPESMPEPSNSGSDPDTSDEQSRNSAREIRHMFDVLDLHVLRYF